MDLEVKRVSNTEIECNGKRWVGFPLIMGDKEKVMYYCDNASQQEESLVTNFLIDENNGN